MPELHALHGDDSERPATAAGRWSSRAGCAGFRACSDACWFVAGHAVLQTVQQADALNPAKLLQQHLGGLPESDEGRQPPF